MRFKSPLEMLKGIVFTLGNRLILHNKIDRKCITSIISNQCVIKGVINDDILYSQSCKEIYIFQIYLQKRYTVFNQM